MSIPVAHGTSERQQWTSTKVPLFTGMGRHRKLLLESISFNERRNTKFEDPTAVFLKIPVFRCDSVSLRDYFFRDCLTLADDMTLQNFETSVAARLASQLHYPKCLNLQSSNRYRIGDLKLRPKSLVFQYF